MNVVYATDDNYAAQCGISMLSLMDNNSDLDDIHFYVLDNGIRQENIDKLIKQCDEYGRSISFIDASDFMDRVGFEFNTTGFNPIVLARLFLADYLPESVGFCLYIDCDTVVTGNLSDILDIDMSSKYFAAVPELFMPVNNKLAIGFEAGDMYYNAGILWINLELWRAVDAKSAFLDFYREKEGMLPYNDQDILNYCCKGRIEKLPQKYNMSPNLPYFPRSFMVKLQPGYKTDTVAEYKDMIEHPAIVHFLGDERPWIHGNKNYYREYFYKYRARSLWPDSEIIYGRELYMFCYHVLNLITRVCPWFREIFSSYIGINVYKWFKKK